MRRSGDDAAEVHAERERVLRAVRTLPQAEREVLDVEEMLTTSAGRLNVPIPSVISYTLFLEAWYTDSVD